MTHRAESIIGAMTTAVTGLVTTGNNVVRGQVYPLSTFPGLAVDMGPEIPVGDANVAYQDQHVDINIVAYVQDNDGVDTVLNQIRSELYAAIMANRTLGLLYVIDIECLGRATPERTDQLEKKSAKQESTYRVYYRHSYADAEN